ncbi:methyl-accepting chemotaxis protein [Methylobacterium planeticum]|uniref:methyl-accepting chemotaxis protein n=1 Tax=Methylobacterium planeticum TaxID=2615211 RepID=UPI0038995080
MSHIANLKIAVKIGATLVFLIGVGLATSLVSLSNLSKIEETGRWTAHTHVVLQRLNDIVGAMVNQETGLRGYLISGNDAFLEPYRLGAATYAEAHATALRLTADNPVQQKHLADLDAQVRSWRTDVVEREIALMRETSTREAARALEASGAGKAAMDALRRIADQTADAERALLRSRDEAAKEAADFSRLANGAGLATMLLAAGLSLLLLHLGISRPIRRLNAVMGRLAAHDLSVTVTSVGRRDEVGEMAAAVQVFKESLIRASSLEEEAALARAGVEAQRKAAMRELADGFEDAVGGIVHAVSLAATGLQDTAQGLNANAGRTAEQAVTVAAAAEEAAANVTMVASAAEELGSSVDEIGRQVQGSATLASAAVQEAGQTAALVQALSAGATKIGDVVSLISSIAGQTNLLALNATIEAARAGDAGRGFAVVAAEVKELASQTARATDEISRQIADIQNSTSQAVMAIESITGRVSEMRTVTAAIAVSVEQQGSATREIVRNVGHAASGTGEVTRSIASVAGAADETGGTAGHLLTSASDLSSQSTHLGAEVRRFLDSVRAA